MRLLSAPESREWMSSATSPRNLCPSTKTQISIIMPDNDRGNPLGKCHITIGYQAGGLLRRTGTLQLTFLRGPLCRPHGASSGYNWDTTITVRHSGRGLRSNLAGRVIGMYVCFVETSPRLPPPRCFEAATCKVLGRGVNTLLSQYSRVSLLYQTTLGCHKKYSHLLLPWTLHDEAHHMAVVMTKGKRSHT
jgi:hypothetical protein